MKNILRRLVGSKASDAFQSGVYWEERYAAGGNSGAGSYGEHATFKASFLEHTVEKFDIKSVIEFGCGDGHQLSLVKYPSYIGLDVSKHAILRCKQRFEVDETKSFFLMDPTAFVDRHELFRAELALSLDVIFHLVEDDVFENHIQQLLSAARRFVIIYSSNEEVDRSSRHVRHRRFTTWLEQHYPQWKLVSQKNDDTLKVGPTAPAKGMYLFERQQYPAPGTFQAACNANSSTS